MAKSQRGNARSNADRTVETTIEDLLSYRDDAHVDALIRQQKEHAKNARAGEPDGENYPHTFVHNQARQANPLYYIENNEPSPFTEARGNPRLAGIFYIVAGGLIALMGLSVSFWNGAVRGVEGIYEDGVLVTTRIVLKPLDLDFEGVILPFLFTGLVGGFFIFIGSRYIKRAGKRPERLKKAKPTKDRSPR